MCLENISYTWWCWASESVRFKGTNNKFKGFFCCYNQLKIRIIVFSAFYVSTMLPWHVSAAAQNRPNQTLPLVGAICVFHAFCSHCEEEECSVGSNLQPRCRIPLNHTNCSLKENVDEQKRLKKSWNNNWYYISSHFWKSFFSVLPGRFTFLRSLLAAQKRLHLLPISIHSLTVVLNPLECFHVSRWLIFSIVHPWNYKTSVV